MRVLVIAGFLGSGKTTLLLAAARALLGDGFKVAIVENEVGQIGLDQRYLRSQGLDVQEVLGGCICCTLQTSLVDTVVKVRDVIAPDWLIVEPTGAARPGDVVASLRRAEIGRDRVHVVAVLDAPRFPMYAALMEPMLISQLETADTVAVNKVDEVSGAEVSAIVERVRSLGWSGPLDETCAEDGSGLEAVLGRVRSLV